MNKVLRIDTYSSTFSWSLWSTVKEKTAPPWASKIQRESPTEATVTVHLSTITNVAVVPDVSPEERHSIDLNRNYQSYLNAQNGNLERIKKKNWRIGVNNPMPLLWNSLSVFTNPATKARGKAWSHSSRPRSRGIAPKIWFNKFSLVYIAAAFPLCPSKIWQLGENEDHLIEQERYSSRKHIQVLQILCLFLNSVKGGHSKFSTLHTLL